MKKLRAWIRGHVLYSTLALTLCFALMLALILSVTLSRYGSDASGDGGAIPAKFEVTASGGVVEEPLLLFGIKPGEINPSGTDKTALTRTIQVHNAGEVPVFYRVEVHSYGNLPLVFSVSDGGTGVLAAGEDSRVYTVTIEWPATEKDASLADELDLVWITLYYEQAN